jgi:hypothetical protein
MGTCPVLFSANNLTLKSATSELNLMKIKTWTQTSILNVTRPLEGNRKIHATMRMQMVGNLSLTSTSNKICHFFSIGKLMVGK